MAEDDRPVIDPITGTATTGHEWDGLTELNEPLPRWWLWIFYATIIWALGYWIVYPAWPLMNSFTGGVLGWHSRTAVDEQLDALEVSRAPMIAKLTDASFDGVKTDPALFDFTLAYGRIAFLENCSPCHGTGGGGAIGYPNLIDDEWLWGGSTDAVAHTIAYGVRNDHAESRQSDMPAFGRDEILTSTEIRNVAQYVRSMSGLTIPEKSDLVAGADIYEQNCAACHGDDGGGNQELGAPSLSDAVWLYGASADAVIATVTNARNSSMPAWDERLDSTTIKALTFYVQALGGGE